MSWELTDAVNPRQVSQKFDREVRYRPILAWMTGENYAKAMGVDEADVSPFTSDNPKPSGALIENYTDLKSKGTNLDIPVIRGFKTGPVAGDAASDGTGERAHPDYQKAYIYPVKKDT